MAPSVRRQNPPGSILRCQFFGETLHCDSRRSSPRARLLSCSRPRRSPRAPARPAAVLRASPTREITQITGDLYRANNGNWYTIFLVTPDGIILGDPINVEFAAVAQGRARHALRGQARALRRLQPQPLRSRRRRSRVRRNGDVRRAREHGCATWTAVTRRCRATWSTATTTASSIAREIEIPTNTRPGVCGMGTGLLRHVRPQRRRHDDTARAAARSSSSRRCVYSERMRIELGGKVVELVHPGLNHSDDATVMLFPARTRACSRRSSSPTRS